MPGLPVVAQTTILPIGSNVFMTFAWYAHLRNLNDKPWWIAACPMAAVCFVRRGQG